MDSRLIALLDRVRQSGSYDDVVFKDVNAVNADGENALHWAVHFHDLEAARLLIASGINVNQPGDLGRTPLHEACAAGHSDMVRLLVENGADLYAHTEGDIPFTVARLNGHDAICALLRPLMDQAQAKDPQVWLRARLRQLEGEVLRLKAKLK